MGVGVAVDVDVTVIVGVEVAVNVDVTVAVGMDVAVGVEAADAVTMTTGDGAGLGMDCWVCAMAAETVPATIVSMASVSAVSVGRGAEEVGSPGTTQARMIARKIGAMKKDPSDYSSSSSLRSGIKKPPGYYSREASMKSV